MASTTTIRRNGTQRQNRTASGTHLTLQEHVETYLDHLARRDKSPRTLRTYDYVLKHYVEAFADRDVSTITLPEVEAWVMRPRRRAVTNVTLRKDAVIVRGFHLWLAERGVHTTPLRTLQFGKLGRTMPKPVEDDVWRKLWGADLDPLDRLWLGLGYFAGLRRLEIVSLRPVDVDLEQRLLTFQRKGGFYAAVEYGVAFDFVERDFPHLTLGHEWPHLFAEHVAWRREIGANFVWPDSTAGDELDCNRLNKRSERLRRSVGLPDGSVTPHRLRHSAATNLLRCGLPIEVIARFLAHSSVDITQRYLQMSGELGRAYHLGAKTQNRGRP